MHRHLSCSPSGQDCQDGNVGHMYGGAGGQIIMIVLKVKKELADLSAIEWGLTNVAGRGDSVILLGVVPEPKKCRPKLTRHFRTTLGLMCHGVCPDVRGVLPMRERLADEQTFKTKESYRRIFRNFQQPCKTRDVKLQLEIVRTAGHSLRQVAVQQACASKAEWVILDRHLRKARHFFIKRLPCNLVLMTDSKQGSILKLGPGWRLQRGDCCLEACGGDETRVPIVLPEMKRDRHNHNTSEDSSDYTGSGDSDRSSHGGDKNPLVQHRGIRGNDGPPPSIVEIHEGETSSSDESYHSTRDSPQWSSGVCSPEQETSYSTATWTGVLPLPLCSACKNKVPDFGKPKEIPFEEIVEATNNFSECHLLANCKLGTVYKGFLLNGQVVSVKRLEVDSEFYTGDLDFFTEIGILSLAHHVNVVTLVGFCIDYGERILVFEFACNEDLSWHLSPLNNRTPLPWSTRRKIALQAARGLRYLHEECRAGSIVHGSMELDSIRLTHDFAPVICNFSQARLRPHSDRASASRSKRLGSSITTESDVYSFGVLLLELINGGRVTDPEVDPIAPGELAVLDSVRTKLDLTSAFKLLDPALEGDFDENELQSMVHAASQCIQTESSLRPSMSKVLSILEGHRLEEEIYDQMCACGLFCRHVTADRFDMISAGVMVF